MKILKNNKGNMLILLAVSLVVLGAQMTTAMSVWKVQAGISTRMNQDFYIGLYVGQITRLLAHAPSCQQTLQGLNPSGTGSVFTSVNVRPSGAPVKEVFRTGDSYGHTSLLRLERLEVRNLSGANAEVVVDFSRKGEVIGVQRSQRLIPIKVELSAGQITSCYAANVMKPELACAALGGTMVNSRCSNLNVVNNLSADGAINVGSGAQVARSFTGTTMTIKNQLEAGLLATLGGLVAGGATTTATTAVTNYLSAPSVRAGTQVCNMGACQNFAPQSCGVNQYIYAIGANGGISCASVY